MSILFGLIGIGIGAMIVMKSEKMLSAFGRIEFFEKHLGSDGGSRLGYKLFGILIIFLSMLIMTGMIDGFMMFFLEPLIRQR